LAPNALPEELPLTPAIAPGLVALHDRSAAIIDNLNMMLDVLTDVLVHPAVVNRRATVDAVIAQFTDRQYGVAARAVTAECDSLKSIVYRQSELPPRTKVVTDA
jgi:hypothetical protein